MENSVLTRRDITFGVAVGVLVGAVLAAALVIGVALVVVYASESSDKSARTPLQPAPKFPEIDLNQRFDVSLQHESGPVRSLVGCKLMGRAEPPPDQRWPYNWSKCELQDGRTVYFQTDDMIALEASTSVASAHP
jgi:hypothetical protein